MFFFRKFLLFIFLLLFSHHRRIFENRFNIDDTGIFFFKISKQKNTAGWGAEGGNEVQNYTRNIITFKSENNARYFARNFSTRLAAMPRCFFFGNLFWWYSQTRCAQIDLNTSPYLADYTTALFYPSSPTSDVRAVKNSAVLLSSRQLVNAMSPYKKPDHVGNVRLRHIRIEQSTANSPNSITHLVVNYLTPFLIRSYPLFPYRL